MTFIRTIACLETFSLLVFHLPNGGVASAVRPLPWVTLAAQAIVAPATQQRDPLVSGDRVRSLRPIARPLNLTPWGQPAIRFLQSKRWSDRVIATLLGPLEEIPLTGVILSVSFAIVLGALPDQYFTAVCVAAIARTMAVLVIHPLLQRYDDHQRFEGWSVPTTRDLFWLTSESLTIGLFALGASTRLADQVVGLVPDHFSWRLIQILAPLSTGFAMLAHGLINFTAPPGIPLSLASEGPRSDDRAFQAEARAVLQPLLFPKEDAKAAAFFEGISAEPQSSPATGPSAGGPRHSYVRDVVRQFLRQEFPLFYLDSQAAPRPAEAWITEAVELVVMRQHFTAIELGEDPHRIAVFEAMRAHLQSPSGDYSYVEWAQEAVAREAKRLQDQSGLDPTVSTLYLEGAALGGLALGLSGPDVTERAFARLQRLMKRGPSVTFAEAILIVAEPLDVKYRMLPPEEAKQLLAEAHDASHNGFDRYEERFHEAVFGRGAYLFDRVVPGIKSTGGSLVKGQGVLWVIKTTFPERMLEREESNDVRYERLAYLLARGRANLAEIRPLGESLAEPGDGLKIHLRQMERPSYLSRLVSAKNLQGDGWVHREPSQAFAALFVSNVWFRKWDPHPSNLVFLGDRPIAIDHDRTFSPNFKGDSKTEWAHFQALYALNVVFQSVRLQVESQGTRGALGVFNVDFDEAMRLLNQRQYVAARDLYAHMIKKFGLQDALAAAENWDPATLRETILSYKEIPEDELKRRIAEAGFYAWEADNIFRSLVANQRRLGQDVESLLRFLTDRHYGLDVLDSDAKPPAATSSHGLFRHAA